jgi:hypothetical protein
VLGAGLSEHSVGAAGGCDLLILIQALNGPLKQDQKIAACGSSYGDVASRRQGQEIFALIFS